MTDAADVARYALERLSADQEYDGVADAITPALAWVPGKGKAKQTHPFRFPLSTSRTRRKSTVVSGSRRAYPSGRSVRPVHVCTAARTADAGLGGGVCGRRAARVGIDGASGMTMSPGREWTAMAAPARAVAARRAVAVIAGTIGTAAVVAGSLAVGLWLGRAQFGFASLIMVAGVIWLATRMWSARPGGMVETTVAVPRPRALALGGVERAVRSCYYDAAEGLLWLRGRAGMPAACVEVEREVACEIVDALGCRERGLRTLDALPGVLAIPFVGGLLGLAVGCALSFGVVMLVAGPPHIGLPAAALTVPLAIVAFRPAVVELRERALVWRWWTLSRELPLSGVDAVRAAAGSLLVRTVSGREHRLRVDMASGGGVLGGAVDAPRHVRLAAFAAFVEQRARRAIAEAFE